MNNRTTNAGQRYHTKADVAYAYLKQEILDGTFAPGASLVLTALAKDLGISQIPIREALQRLNQEGLVSLEPHVGARVSDMSVDGFAENLLIRSELEGLAASLAVDFATEEDIAKLEAIVQGMERALASGDLDAMGVMNRQFHLALYSAIPYRHLYRIIENLWDQVPRARHVFQMNLAHTRESHEEHKRILAALKRRDHSEVRHLVRKQKLRAREVLMREPADLNETTPAGAGD